MSAGESRRRVVAVLGYSPRGGASIHPICAERLARAAEIAAEGDVVVLSGWSRSPGRLAEAELMARAWAGPAVELVQEPSARHTVQNAVEVAGLARRLAAEEVAVVTSWWHRPRAAALVRAGLRGSGARVVGVGARSHAPTPLLLREAVCLALLPVQLLLLRRALPVSARARTRA